MLNRLFVGSLCLRKVCRDPKLHGEWRSPHHWVNYCLVLLLKVLASTSSCYYSLPMTYRGLFQRRPRVFSGGRQLELAANLVVRVVYLSLQEQLAIRLGDRLRVSATSSEANGNYIACEKQVEYYFVGTRCSIWWLLS